MDNRNSNRKIDSVKVLLLPALILSQYLFFGCNCALVEEERVGVYHSRGFQWPPLAEDYKPNTPGWRQLMERRFAQIHHVDSLGDRYNAYLSTVYSSMIAKNFTENGWALTRAPQNLTDKFLRHLHHGLVNNPRTEGHIDAIGGSETKEGEPLFIPNHKLNSIALKELKPILEAWSNTRLVGNNAYGLRVYKNNSNLNMHVDKSETHVISCIYHIDHDPAGEPWPIIIEDFNGNLNEVILESGDMLLYESSKCFHGRPKRFNGSWYTSLFIHYYPIDWRSDIGMDSHYRIPPTWNRRPTKILNARDEVVVNGTSIREPNCENEWCALDSSLKWHIPSIEGSFISNDGIPKPFKHDEL